MARRVGVEAKTGQPVDILRLARAFAMDAVSANVLQQCYGGLDESSALQSAYPFMDFATKGGHFWISQSWYVWIQRLPIFKKKDSKTKKSIETVELFIESLVDQAKTGGTSFPSRLLAKGFPADQVAKECADIIFGGTEATGHVLATICWNLVANPERWVSDSIKSSEGADMLLDMHHFAMR